MRRLLVLASLVALPRTAAAQEGAPVVAAPPVAEAPVPEEPPDAPKTPARARPLVVRGVASLGGSYGAVYGLGSRGLRLEGGVLVRATQSVGFMVTLAHEHGPTADGLGVGAVHVLASAELRLGPVHLGGGPQIGYAWFSRATSRSSVEAIGLGLFAKATLDLLSFDETRASFVGVMPSLDWLHGTERLYAIDRGPLAWRAAAFAGVRF